MRISDWSSDVCSSDLSRALPQGFPVPATPCGIRQAGCVGAGLSVAQRLVEHQRQSVRGLPHALFGQRAVFVQVGLVELVRAGRIQRSEEHTSELQSLMRSSYAVFCLKTKKTNN